MDVAQRVVLDVLQVDYLADWLRHSGAAEPVHDLDCHQHRLEIARTYLVHSHEKAERAKEIFRVGGLHRQIAENLS